MLFVTDLLAFLGYYSLPFTKELKKIGNDLKIRKEPTPP